MAWLQNASALRSGTGAAGRKQYVRRNVMARSKDMEFESWMTCEPLATDGETTIGLVNDSAARWAGDLNTLAEGQPFEYAENGESFAAGGVAYRVDELVWRVVPRGAKTLYLNRRILREIVAPQELEAIGASLFVNGKAFSQALQAEGTYFDPVDFKLYEWK